MKTLQGLSHWRLRRPGRETVDIRRMISPLRYDIQIRIDFFSRLEAHGSADPEHIAAREWDLDYGRWFRDVAMVRYRPWVLRDPEVTYAQFCIRVRTAMELYESISTRGFATNRPIGLSLATQRARSELGVPMEPRLHSGDGSHRLAILALRQGHLLPEQYVVRPDRRPLLDNTVRLFGPEDADSATYLGFIGAHWTSEKVTTRAALVSAVERDAGPRALAEVESILASHEAAWHERARI